MKHSEVLDNDDGMDEQAAGVKDMFSTTLDLIMADQAGGIKDMPSEMST